MKQFFILTAIITGVITILVIGTIVVSILNY
jgi:hypothetical protein